MDIESNEQWNELARQARQLTATGTEMETAAGLREVLHQVVQAMKGVRPGGEGLDGHDGPERQGIEAISDAAENHYFDTLRRVRR